MYLKSLEMIGFKSFADKTRLEFEPGITAIVGPNGCGKSNISDAVRWVLGEQSVKALRGSKMEDCIFNGTDTRKPIGMAEVSITFADCEEKLGLDYNEITITRRVFRSGEGEYFINRTPCRLKDIQRLFMDTGIGTVSYSLMEQGRIDRVLSAHPEDRRAIFEEASGITKFKADRSEALRKLEHTEANLLRLSDVIREVKRQIGSLQRQAAKARAYKAIHDEMRRLDIHVAREHIKALDARIESAEKRASEIAACILAAQEEVAAAEKQTSELRSALMQTQREISAEAEAAARSQNRLDHGLEMIRSNRQRIEEHQAWAKRDEAEIEANRAQLEEKKRDLDSISSSLAALTAEKNDAEKRMNEALAALEEHLRSLEETRSALHSLRSEQVEADNMYSRLQNELVELESRQRNAEISRERLLAERSQIARSASELGKKLSETDAAAAAAAARETAMAESLARAQEEVSQAHRCLTECRSAVEAVRAQEASLAARLEMLSAADPSSDFPQGAQALIAGACPDIKAGENMLGGLAGRIRAPREYQAAMETALRAYLDAVLVASERDGRAALSFLEKGQKGSARLMFVEAGQHPLPEPPPGTTVLADVVQCDEAVAPLVRRILGNVLVVESVASIPDPLPHGFVLVTRSGALARSDGFMEFWCPGSAQSNPLSRRHQFDETSSALDAVRRELAERQEALRKAEEAVAAAEAARAEAMKKHQEAVIARAQRDAERRMVAADAAAVREKLDTVEWEIKSLSEQDESGRADREKIGRRMKELSEHRERLTADIAEMSHDLQRIEETHTRLQSEATQRQLAHAALTQKIEHVSAQAQAARSRISEIESAIAARMAGVASYQESVRRLNAEILEIESNLDRWKQEVQERQAAVEQLHSAAEARAAELAGMEKTLSARRAALEEKRSLKAEQDIRLTEDRMRRQNLLDRILADYSLTLETFLAEPPPQWDGPSPTLEECEAKLAELRTKLEAMGPVNLVAIEEHKELEERYAFLTVQEADLTRSKQQLMDFIRKIDATTSEMFAKTFAQVNENFQTMFSRLFNGGTAKLVLVNEQDMLECGIEILVRPPGKRLQNVSLLSGGERTLTAVALLFAIYMIKPSPFCLLDELDAALDESNIGRFVNVLKGFTNQSQFVIITHNRQSIAAADVVYGVTMREKGVSSIVSMRFRDDSPAPDTQARPEEAPAPEPEPSQVSQQ